MQSFEKRLAQFIKKLLIVFSVITGISFLFTTTLYFVASSDINCEVDYIDTYIEKNKQLAKEEVGQEVKTMGPITCKSYDCNGLDQLLQQLSGEQMPYYGGEFRDYGTWHGEPYQGRTFTRNQLAISYVELSHKAFFNILIALAIVCSLCVLAYNFFSWLKRNT